MKLAIVVGTTRPGRKTLQQAKWVQAAAEQLTDTSAELLDLADYRLPFFNEPISPRYNPNREPAPEVKKWLSKLAEFDAYVFVTAEYNHAMPGELKNALDFVDWQFVHKPGAVVSHGSAGGARAMTVLKEVLSEDKMVIIPVGPSLAITGMSEIIDEDGVMSEAMRANPRGAQADLEAMLKDLQWYSNALATART